MTRALFITSQAGDATPLLYRDMASPADWYDWTFDYLGASEPRTWFEGKGRHLSYESPAGGVAMARNIRTALELPDWDYFGVCAHDISVKLSDVDRMLRMGRRMGLAAFSAAETCDSFNSYSHMHVQPGRFSHDVPFIECFCGFYRRDIIAALLPFYDVSMSGCGVDNHALPFVARGERIAVFDSCPCYHADPNRSSERTYNGRTTEEEMNGVCELVMREARRLASLEPAP